MTKRVEKLRHVTGCNLKTCKDAIRYADARNGGKRMAINYCKVKELTEPHIRQRTKRRRKGEDV